MSKMFYYCDHLINVDLSSFESKKVKSMELMFFWCSELRYLDMSEFDLNNVENKTQIFYLSSLDRSNDMHPNKNKIIRVHKNSIEEFKKLITSKSAEILIKN